MTTFTIELDEAKSAALKRLASEGQQTPEQVIAAAVETWLEFGADDVRATEEGIAAIESGETIANEDVVRWLQSWGTDKELDPPKWRG